MASAPSGPLMSQKQNVVVGVRVRPLNDQEVACGGKVAVRVKENNLWVTDPNGGERAFTFDQCFWSIPSMPSPNRLADQDYVYESIGKAVAGHALEGFNACIFAYGQTGSGKTHTMMGNTAKGEMGGPGVIPLLCNDLFHYIEENSKEGSDVSFKSEVSFFEIYNEKVRCLLSPVAGEELKELKVREHPVTGPYVEGLTRRMVNSYSVVRQLMEQGNQNRTIAETRHNARSSRSHAVFSLIITQTKIDRETGLCSDLVSRVNLVDLAGSERLNASSSEEMKDGISINKSLSFLGKVIHSLSEREKAKQSKRGVIDLEWVSYRESKLTWVLKENLGGNSKTVMLACISPSSTQSEVTLNTLRYADQVKYIRNNAVVNEDQNSCLIKELQQEIRFLRMKLDEREGSSSPHRRSSYSVKPNAPDWRTVYRAKLESSEEIIAELNQQWESRMDQYRQLYHENIAGLKKQFQQGTQKVTGVRIEGCTPLLVSLDPHLVQGECVAWSVQEGKTYVTSDDDPLSTDNVSDIRLSEGVNLSNPHCLLENTNGNVVITPINGSLTYVDGVLLTDPVELRHATRLIFGSAHAFYFLDPTSAQSIRNARKGARVPKVLDWAYASEEFAQTMECCRSYDEVIQLMDQVEHYRGIAEGDRDLSHDAGCLVLVSELPPSQHGEPGPSLVFPLQDGNNVISPYTWGLPNLKVAVTLEVVRGQVFLKTEGGKTPSRILSHGCRLAIGDSVVAVSCPLAPPEPAPEGGPSPSSGRRSTVRSGREVKRRDLVVDEVALEELRGTLLELKFQILLMRDLLYPPPFEDEDAQLPELTEEEQVLMERRMRLKEPTPLEGGLKALTARHFVEYTRQAISELRQLSHDFAHRLDHPPPPAFSGGKPGVVAEPTRQPHGVRSPPRHAPTSPDASLTKKVAALQEELETKVSADGVIIASLESKIADAQAALRAEAERADDLVKENAVLNRRIQDLAADCEAWRRRGVVAEEELQKLRRELVAVQESRSSPPQPSSSPQVRVQDEHQSEVGKEELQQMAERARRAEATAADARAELSEKIAENDRLLSVLQHLREDTTPEAETVAHLKELLHAETAKSSVLQKRIEALEAERDALLHGPRSIESELQGTITVLANSSKKDKKTIQQLQQQVSQYTAMMRKMQGGGVLPPDPVNLTAAQSFEDAGGDTRLVSALQQVKAALLPTGSSDAIVDRITREVHTRGVQVLRKAWQAVNRSLPAADVALSEQESRAGIMRALRELVVCYDLQPVFPSDQSETVQAIFSDLGSNAGRLVSLATALAAPPPAESEGISRVHSTQSSSAASFTHSQSDLGRRTGSGRSSPTPVRRQSNHSPSHGNPSSRRATSPHPLEQRALHSSTRSASNSRMNSRSPNRQHTIAIGKHSSQRRPPTGSVTGRRAPSPRPGSPYSTRPQEDLRKMLDTPNSIPPTTMSLRAGSGSTTNRSDVRKRDERSKSPFSRTADSPRTILASRLLQR